MYSARREWRSFAARPSIRFCHCYNTDLPKRPTEMRSAATSFTRKSYFENTSSSSDSYNLPLNFLRSKRRKSTWAIRRLFQNNMNGSGAAVLMSAPMLSSAPGHVATPACLSSDSHAIFSLVSLLHNGKAAPCVCHYSTSKGVLGYYVVGKAVGRTVTVARSVAHTVTVIPATLCSSHQQVTASANRDAASSQQSFHRSTDRTPSWRSDRCSALLRLGNTDR